MSRRAPGSRYLRNLRSHSNGAFSSIFLKLCNYDRSECIVIIYKLEYNWNRSFVFINRFHELFAQPSYFSNHPLSADTSFKFLSLILFEISRLQNFISIFSKGHNFTRGDNSKKKKKISVCYFSMRNPYMKFQDDISFQNIIVAKFQGPKF